MCASALPVKTKRSDMCIEINKNTSIFGPVYPNSQSITRCDCYAALCQPDDLQECWWIQKVTGEVWIVLVENIIDTAVNKCRNHLCACGHL